MQELIQRLQQEAGLTEAQARQAIQTMKNFVIDKFPMLESAANKLFGDA